MIDPRRPVLYLMAALCVAAAGAARAEPLHATTTNLPPLAIEASPQRPGALVEVVRELTRRAGMDVTIEFVPWLRAQVLTLSQSQSVIFPLTRTPEREHRFKWLVHLYHDNLVFFALKGRQPLSDLAAMRSRRVVMMRGSSQVDAMRRAGYHIVETNSVADSLRYLRHGLADVMLGDLDTVRKMLSDSGQSDELEASAPLRTTTTWLAGSADIGDAQAARLQRAMKSMLDDGTYARLMKKYELGPQP